jgi:AcrR family transcriptional regulator
MNVSAVNTKMVKSSKKAKLPKNHPYHHGDLRHALIETALELVTEKQDWNFSLREVARRAGVSHRAPYNHFPEKLDLLAAVAAVGFERLRDGLLRSMIGIEGSDEALLVAIARTYVHLGLENPALYRLMFGDALSQTESGRSVVARKAGAEARGVLEDVILRGGRSGVFAVPLDDAREPALTAMSVWSATHGLTMLVIDGVARPDLTVDEMIEKLLQMVVEGLRRPEPRQ